MRKALLILIAICASVFWSKNAASQQYTLIEAASSLDPYGCYDYVRAGLEHTSPAWVNRYTGVPIPGILPSPGHPSFRTGLLEIFNDPKYVYIGSSYNYELIVYQNTGHAVLKLLNGYYASKWYTGGGLYYQTVPNIFNFSLITETPRYMVYIGTPTPTSLVNMSPGQQQDFFVKSVTGLCYSWSYDPNYFTLVSGTNSSNTIRLQAKCPSGSGGYPNQTVSVTVGCSGVGQKVYNMPVNINLSGCPADPCQGTYQINGTGTVYPLNTVNSVSGSPIITTLNGGTGVSYTWTLISGSPSYWYSYGTGNKNLYVALNKNTSANFRFTSSTCNRSITFYRGSTLMATKSLNTLSDSINAQLDTLFMPYDAVNEYDKTAPLDANVNNGVYVNQPRKTLIINDNIEGERAYKIISMQGIQKKNGKIYGGKTEIDIQDLPSGIYIITLEDCSYRFIKQ
jgi:hypothetical protein